MTKLDEIVRGDRRRMNIRTIAETVNADKETVSKTLRDRVRKKRFGVVEKQVAQGQRICP